MNKLTLLARAEVQAKLAEKFWVPCPPGSPCCEGFDGAEYPPNQPPTCGDGSGRQHPLRRKCRGWQVAGQGYCNAQLPDSEEEYPCECGGVKGYIFNDAPGIIWDAVRAKGGILRAWIDYIHDPSVFLAECHLGSSMHIHQFSKADSMAEALELVVLRAWEATNGN